MDNPDSSSVIDTPGAASNSVSTGGIMGTLVQPEMKEMRRSPRITIKNTLLCFTVIPPSGLAPKKEVFESDAPF